MNISPFVFNATSSIVFRPGAAGEIGSIVGQRLGSRVLMVTDPGLRKLGLIDSALASLVDSGIDVSVFDQVEPDPALTTLMAAIEFGRRNRVEGVIGFGGGSSLDVAKLSALVLGSNESLDAVWGVDKAQGPRLPLVLVPTTAGTGSEVTPVSIITVAGDEKRGVSSSFNIPDIAVLDATLTLGLPPAITAATGVDAMVHAIEAIASANANNNLISRTLAREALRLLGANIRTAVKDGSNIEARSGMLLGSMLAGQAFANSPVAAVHALAYPIGGTFHVPHGLSNALVLPHVLRFNAMAVHQTYADMASDAFPNLSSVEGSQAKCGAFIDALAAQAIDLGMPTRLREVGIEKDALAKLAADAMKQQRLLSNNPRPVTEADALDIYRAAW